MPIFRTRMLMFFYRELAQLVSSGVTVIDAMGIMSTQVGSAALKRIAVGLRQYLVSGSSLGDAFSQFPDFFPAFHVSIITYSETAGRLSQGLTGLADYLEKDYQMQQGLIVGLAYPVVLLHAAIFLLPIANAVSRGPGAYVAGVLGMLIPLYGIVCLFYAANRMQKNEQFKARLDNLNLNIPLIGVLVRQTSITRFIRALQALSASGVSIISGWKLAAEACGNNVIKAHLLNALPLLEKGEGLSKVFIQTGAFRPDMIGLITAAEKSGSIVATLNTIASYCERENETALAVITRVLPIVAYIVIAGFIGLSIISFYLGYFNRIFSAGG